VSDTSAERSRHEVPRSSPSTFHVVVNAEGQYSIWDTRRAVPEGWTATGFVGPEAACLDHIDVVWTDMRPQSLRGTEADA
jgi:MbtH protein